LQQVPELFVEVSRQSLFYKALTESRVGLTRTLEGARAALVIMAQSTPADDPI
jgi:hypothetical protein